MLPVVTILDNTTLDSYYFKCGPYTSSITWELLDIQNFILHPRHTESVSAV